MSYSNTQVLGASLHVKKLVSLNPDRFETRTLESMLEKYAEYCFNYGHSMNDMDYKSFKSWLDTEI